MYFGILLALYILRQNGYAVSDGLMISAWIMWIGNLLLHFAAAMVKKD